MSHTTQARVVFHIWAIKRWRQILITNLAWHIWSKKKRNLTWYIVLHKHLHMECLSSFLSIGSKLFCTNISFRLYFVEFKINTQKTIFLYRFINTHINTPKRNFVQMSFRTILPWHFWQPEPNWSSLNETWAGRAWATVGVHTSR